MKTTSIRLLVLIYTMLCVFLNRLYLHKPVAQAEYCNSYKNDTSTGTSTTSLSKILFVY